MNTVDVQGQNSVAKHATGTSISIWRRTMESPLVARVQTLSISILLWKIQTKILTAHEILL
jgi:hypothetical protein